MKKILFTLLIAPLCLFSQNIDLSAYKYVVIEPLNHQGIDNTYGITRSIASAFTSKGLIVANNFSENNIPSDLRSNPCLLLQAVPFYTDGAFAIKLKLEIVNCNKEKLFSKEVSGTATFTVDEAYGKAIKKISKEINDVKYQYDASLTPEFTVPIDPSYNITNTGLSEDSLRKYIDNNRLDAIEGIYKSYRQKDDNSPSYKFAIIKKSIGQYQAIIIESESSIWKAGEVKMILENTALGDVFSAKYYMLDKSKVETFASLNNSILKVDLSSVPNGKENSINSFIKTYPFNSSSSSSSIGSPGIAKALVSSGTGFLISEKGYIATNYHVISDGSKYVAINSDGGKTHELTLVQKDKINDIAILKIKNLEEILPLVPYKLTSQAKIGQNVFTMGYPLNDVMGNNQKVTNGIINSLTGVQDDSRYFQISVPIQPGNSGGPLFDYKGGLIGITTASLNEDAVKTNVQNVNYAIKINLLQNIISLMPDNEQVKISSAEDGTEIPLSLLSEKYKPFIFKISTFK